MRYVEILAYLISDISYLISLILYLLIVLVDRALFITQIIRYETC